MSTLSIHTPRTASTSDSVSDVDARFDALVRTAVPAQRSAPTVSFETVFDLDYGQVDDEPQLLRTPAARPSRAARTARTARRARVTVAKSTTPRHVRLTRRGRVVATLVFVTIALGVMTALGGWATASLSGGTPERVRIVEVQPGDTLYDIAADLAQPGEIRAMVHRIQELNSLPGASITEGQKLAVPRG